MPIKRAHIFISGRVQGVFFRQWSADHARRLGLAGWVRNRLDGQVEAVFEGPAGSVDKMVELCREGPPHARVDTILDDYSQSVEGLTGFEVKSSV
ncbi:MAG: acylphosphatase [Thermoleophilia bacterium]|nr:acylphosphatase [Thermoleophilia bacterium]